MVSASGLAVLALSTTAVMAFPKAHGAYYGHQRYHASGISGSGYASPTGGHHHHHHNGTYTNTYAESVSTEWITVTVYPVESTTLATNYAAPTTANAVVQTKGVCGGPKGTKTITSTSTVYVTVTPSESSTTAEAATTTTEAVATTTAAAPPSSYSEAGSSTADAVYTSPTTEAAATTPATTGGAGQFYGGTTSQATSEAAATTSAAASGNGYTGSKKGLSFTEASGLSMFSKSGSSWAYNWGSAPASGATMPEGVEYVPMCWGANSASKCSSAVQDAVQKYGATHVLSFNEPDLPAQANLSPQDAYKLHVENVAKPLAGTVKIGSPAVTNSGTSGQGLDWMKSFLELCYANNQDACKLDFLAVHWYANTESFDYFKSHMTDAMNLADKYGIGGVWLTEFAATDGSPAQEAEFLTKAMTWLDSDEASKIERYAYFLAGNAAGMGMVTGDALNAIGQVYDAVS